jgi:hypothetical protein
MLVMGAVYTVRKIARSIGDADRTFHTIKLYEFMHVGHSDFPKESKGYI